MHGREREQHELLTTVSLEERIPESHPIRRLRRITDEVLTPLRSGLRELYADTGRPGVPPECLLRALILQAVFSVRSERQLVEQLQYNLLFRWFVGLGLDDEAWDGLLPKFEDVLRVVFPKEKAMKNSKFSEEQIVGILEEAADGPAPTKLLGVRELARAL